jgi:phage terminase small subunit
VDFRYYNGDMRQISKEVKEIQGTFEPSKEGFEPVALELWDGQRMPAADSKWPPNIQEIWNLRCKELFKAGYLAKSFLPRLKRYCFAIMAAEEAEENLFSGGFIEESIGTKGQVYRSVSPWFSIWEKAVKEMDAVSSRYGFSPLDIQKIPVIEKKQDKDSLIKIKT